MDRAYRQVCSSQSPDWLEHRKAGIGSSEMPALLGVGFGNRDALRLYAEKTGILEPPDLSENEAVRWGHKLEAVVLKDYSERTGRTAVRARKLLRSRKHPWALATLDGWTQHPEHGRIPLEIKTTSAYKADDWVKTAPPAVLVQVQQQLLVTGLPAASVACLIGGQLPVWCDVPANPEVQEKIVEAGRRFWGALERREPPPPSLWSGEVIAALYPQDNGRAVVWGPEMQDAVRAWVRAKEEEKRAQALVEKYRTIITAELGENERAILPDHSVLTWKTEHRKAYSVEPSDRRVLRYSNGKAVS